ncbi:MAG: ABC transporter permease [Thalassobaculum sp.]
MTVCAGSIRSGSRRRARSAAPGCRLFRRVRLPAALPAFASGLRVATAVAPIGAVVGEWVGSSAGLGYLMLHANARLQIDLMFAALLTLAVMAVALYATVDAILRRAVAWQPGEADPEPANRRRPHAPRSSRTLLVLSLAATGAGCGQASRSCSTGS